MTEMVPAVLNGEYEIVLPRHRAERPEWYSTTGWEADRLNELCCTIREQADPVVYYVGAEEGEMAALCQIWGGEVVLFEPNPKVWPNIRAIWDANGLTAPRCFAGFASNLTDLNPPNGEPHREGDTFPWPECAYGPVIGDHGFKELYQEADAFPQIRIDDLTDTPAPTIISFDVEGSEWQVLRGAEQTIRTHKPVLFASIHPEFMFHQWGEYSRDFRNWIIALGYREDYIAYEHELHMVYTPL